MTLNKAHIAYFSKTDSLYNEIFGTIVKHKNDHNDLQTIKADYLIDNIVCAFDEWKNSPILKNIDFDTLFILNKSPIPYLQEIELNNTKMYRYYRFLTHDKGSVNIYTLLFHDGKEWKEHETKKAKYNY
jgi:hypothetical protein